MKIDSVSLNVFKNVKRSTSYKLKEFRKHLSSASAVEPSFTAALPEQNFLETFQGFDYLEYHSNNAYKKGETLLSLLTALRIDLLSGNIPYARIQKLHHFLHSLSENSDPLLQEILDEITLRVQIELAKIEKIS